MSTEAVPLPDDHDCGWCIFRRDGRVSLQNGNDLDTRMFVDTRFSFNDGELLINPGRVVAEHSDGTVTTFEYQNGRWCQLGYKEPEAAPQHDEPKAWIPKPLLLCGEFCVFTFKWGKVVALNEAPSFIQFGIHWHGEPEPEYRRDQDTSLVEVLAVGYDVMTAVMSRQQDQTGGYVGIFIQQSNSYYFFNDIQNRLRDIWPDKSWNSENLFRYELNAYYALLRASRPDNAEAIELCKRQATEAATDDVGKRQPKSWWKKKWAPHPSWLKFDVE